MKVGVFLWARYPCTHPGARQEPACEGPQPPTTWSELFTPILRMTIYPAGYKFCLLCWVNDHSIIETGYLVAPRDIW